MHRLACLLGAVTVVACSGDASPLPTASGSRATTEAPPPGVTAESSPGATPRTRVASTVSASAGSAGSTTREPPSAPGARVRERDGAAMVFVPAGPFVRGSPKGVGDDDEFPPRRVNVGAFLIDRLEVTVAQYRACTAAGACSEPSAKKGAATDACNWGAPERDAHPVNCVVWQEAADYCRWVEAALPTEAQWEKAARGPDGRLYPWGNEPASCSFAVMPTATGVAGCGEKSTWPAGTMAADESPYGARDMSGNVREWVADFYDEHAYEKGPSDDPRGPPTGWARALRGGSWEVHDPAHMRAANRYRFQPTFRFHGAGFRCARAADG